MKAFLDRYLKILDWYIIKKYLGTFFFTLILFIVISVVFDISEHMDNFLTKNATLYEIAFKYYAGFIPFYMDLLSPLINFLAVIFFTAKMANQTEIVPILSGKVSFSRFLRPYFVSAAIIFVISFFASVFLIPFTNALKINFENTHGFYGDASKNDVHLQLDKNTYVYAQSYDNNSHSAYMFVLEKFDGDVLREKLVASNAIYDSVKRVWSFRNYSVRYVNGLRETLKMDINQKDTVLDLQPSDFVVNNAYPAMSLKELNKRIEKEKIRSAGDLKDMEYEKYKRFVHPLSSFVLMLIGVSISSRKVRGGIGLPLGIGLFLCFAYIVVDKFALVFAIKSNLSPLVAVFLPNGLFGLLGLYLLRKAPK
ncbi:LptF/LptG family permease [Mucilaginibacter puniceus]